MQGVTKQQQKLDPPPPLHKSVGPDFISAIILRETATEMAPYPSIMYQQSIVTGTVPENWKLAYMTGVYNKRKRDVASNYRLASH